MNNISRRRFVTLFSAAAAGAALAPRAFAARAETSSKKPGRFEVSASLYAWDLHDEGVERVLDNLELAAVNSVYLLGIMHPEARPVGGGTFPHNPVRKTWVAEDARCYWHPTARRYGRVKPRLSDHTWLNDTDWLTTLSDAARKRGMKVGVEFSHALIDRERMAGELADLSQLDLHGKPVAGAAIKWLQAPCPNHPETIEYLLALVTDTVADHGVDYVQSCMMTFDPATPERGGGCFCQHCRKAAPDFGVDLEKVQAALLADVHDSAALASWNEFRYASVARLYQKLHSRMHELRATSDLRYNLHSHSYAYYGVNPPRLRPFFDSARVLDYTEQNGDPALMAKKRPWLDEARQLLGPDMPLLPSVGVRMKATPELVRQGVKIVTDSGAVGITLGHYDGASLELLRAVREGLVTAGVVS
ncbi:MAG TPA: hypothetical protein VFT72_00285 [Opitutaceae bacterium]|nr:hypothetical protein [Opitutaceae bacterium]